MVRKVVASFKDKTEKKELSFMEQLALERKAQEEAERKAKEEWESVEKAQHARHEYITGKKRGDRHTRDILLDSSLQSPILIHFLFFFIKKYL